MPVEAHGLRQREDRIVLIDVAPARLHHGHGGLLQEGKRSQEEVGFGDKIGVKDRNELPGRVRQSLCQRPCLVAVTLLAMAQSNMKAFLTIVLDETRRDRRGSIGGVVQNVDL